MAVNVTAANNQANQLSSYASQLRQAKTLLNSYRGSLTTNWQGKEVNYILTAIDQVVRDIDSAIKSINSLSGDIKNTAAQIKREEEVAAAAARARAEKQQRIRAAQNAYDAARLELNDLISRKENLNRVMRQASVMDRFHMSDMLLSLDEEIKKAENKCSNAYNALRAANR